MDQRKFKDIAGSFATGVTVITTKNSRDYPVGMTANSFTSLSINPPLILVNIDKNASLYRDFMTNDRFVVNILSDDQKDICKQFSTKNIDRFAGVDYEEDVTGAPVLKNVLGYFDCAVVNRYDGGDHTIIIGETKSGDVKEGNPLVFFKGRYAQLETELVK